MMQSTQPLRLKSFKLSPGSGVRTGMSVADLRQSFLDNLFCGLGRVPMAASPNDIHTALALTVRDRVHKKGVRTLEARIEQKARIVAYFSAEFLSGPIGTLDGAQSDCSIREYCERVWRAEPLKIPSWRCCTNAGRSRGLEGVSSRGAHQ